MRVEPTHIVTIAAIRKKSRITHHNRSSLTENHGTAKITTNRQKLIIGVRNLSVAQLLDINNCKLLLRNAQGLVVMRFPVLVINGELYFHWPVQNVLDNNERAVSGRKVEGDRRLR